VDQKLIVVKSAAYRFPQRLEAAFLAISLRFRADMPAALAFPPMRPKATAAGFLHCDSGVERTFWILPVAILATMTARAFTLAGCFLPFGPLGGRPPFPRGPAWA
jgi:hypothetical protein